MPSNQYGISLEQAESIWNQIQSVESAPFPGLEMKTKEPEVPRKKEEKANTFIRYFKGSHKGLAPKSGRFGIEIETEAKNKASYPNGFLKETLNPLNGSVYWEVPMDYWKAVKDGSLRNFGVEFVLRDPLDFVDVKKALDEFEVQTKGVKFLDGEVGTSIHVHCNVQNESLLFLGNFLTLLLLFENLLVEFSGETRRSNLFALPTKSAEGNLHVMKNMFKRLEKGELNSIAHSDENVKYAAINLSKLSAFGSIEIRCFRGTTKTDEIEQWVSLLDLIFNAARMPGLTPKGIISEMQRRPYEFFSEVFGSKKVLLQTRDFKRLFLSDEISSCLFFAKSLAGAVDFETLDQKVWEAVERKESGLSKISPKIISYATRYGGNPEMYGLTVSGQIVTLDHPDCIGQSDSKVIKKAFPYPVNGKKIEQVHLDEVFDEHDEEEPEDD